jgi:hypothetical protein
LINLKEIARLKAQNDAIELEKLIEEAEEEAKSNENKIKELETIYMAMRKKRLKNLEQKRLEEEKAIIEKERINNEKQKEKIFKKGILTFN